MAEKYSEKIQWQRSLVSGIQAENKNKTTPQPNYKTTQTQRRILKQIQEKIKVKKREYLEGTTLTVAGISTEQFEARGNFLNVI